MSTKLPPGKNIRHSSSVPLVAVLAGIVGMVLCVLTPFLPVEQHNASIAWPQEQTLSATSSVTAPLVAQVPKNLDVRIPCSLLADINTRAVVFSTITPTADAAAARGLFITANPTTVTVSFRAAALISMPRAQIKKCQTIHAWSTPHEVGAQFVGFGPVVTDNPALRPHIGGIYSSLSPAQVKAAQTQGLSARIDIDNRFDSSPSIFKLLAMILGGLAVAVSLVALFLLDKQNGYHRYSYHESWKAIATQQFWAQLVKRLRPRPVDIAVTGVISIWYFLGAGSPDDGYILNMGRGSTNAGYLANYYRFFGIPEAPFDWYYSLLSWWSHFSTTHIWMGLPGLAALLFSWYLLSRVLLPRLGSGVSKNRWAIATAGAVYLSFVLAFASGLRSETIVIVGSLITLWAVERTIATRRLLPGAIAALTAGLTLATAPTGVLAVAILIVGSRPMLRIVLARRHEAGILTLVAPFAAAAAFVLLIIFRDQTVATIFDAIRTRYAIGPVLSWNQDYLRWYFITVPTLDGALVRRVPLLLLLASLLVTLAVMLRRKRIQHIAPAPVWRLLGSILITMLLFSFMPTKWTIHFGVYAGVGSALAAIAVVAVTESASRSTRNLTTFIAGLLFAMAAAFAGENNWPWAYNIGISWFDRSPELAGIQFSTAVLVLAIGTAGIAVWQHLRLDYVVNKGLAHTETSAVSHNHPKQFSTADRRRLTFAAVPILTIAAVMVLGELAIFSKAVVSRGAAYTVFSGNINALKGNSCAMSEEVLVELDPNSGLLTPAAQPNQIPLTAATALAGTDSIGFTPQGVADDLTPELTVTKPGQMNVSANMNRNFVIDGAGAGLLGGTGPTTINGSTAALPFGLDPKKTPVLGSYGFNTANAKLTTSWYQLPSRNSTPLLVFSAAGAISSIDREGIKNFGQSVTMEFGHRGTNGSFLSVGLPVRPIDPGNDRPNRPWRNLRVPMELVPAAATVVRIVVQDNNLNPKQWVAITPPRAAQLQTLQAAVGNSPTLIDFAVGSQFPCQQPYRIRSGVMEVPRWRILPDRLTALSQSKTWQASRAGGALSVYETNVKPDTVATYLKNDPYQDWGALERLTPLTPDASTAIITHSSSSRWGYTRSGPLRMAK